MLANYSRVKLLNDKHDENAFCGDIGYIIETYDDGTYEVEFSREDGSTKALIVVHLEEVALAEAPVTRIEAGTH